ncbi:DUF1877 family protein [Kribbella deserti]|uniref:DUF1877 family protein n=1 Tax=Kribbella deserti TaxID=1926257 RepID=A0ABV6QQW3_9ACTN
MSLTVEYLRLTPAELAHALADPAWAEDFMLDSPRSRRFSKYKAWDALRFLLARVDFPVDLFRGECEMPGAEPWFSGLPRYLPPDRVALAAATLAGTTYADLIAEVDPAELDAAEVYPPIWHRPDQLYWPREWFDGLRTFLLATAESGDAIVVWRG